MTKHKTYKLEEKFYVAECISSNFNRTFGQSYYIIDQEVIDETMAKYYLVLLGMFSSKVKCNRLTYSMIAADTFHKYGKEDISEHFFEWLIILKQLSACWNLEVVG